MKIDKFIPVNEPYLKGNILKYLNQCVKSNWISSEGPFVTKFEKSFADSVNRKYAVAVSSGTAAIDIAIECLNLPKGSEVIVTSFTIISTINQILKSGLVPVFVDVDKYNWNINEELIENKISKKTKAIIIVHTYGLPANLNKIIKISSKYNLKIIEDSAEMHGQYYFDKPCGSFGDISIFSFYSNKLITTGEGGMILTNNKRFYEKAKSLKNLCFNLKNRFVHNHLGWNYRMTNLQAAVGLSQLEILNLMIKKKKKISNLYNSLFSNNSNLQLPIKSTVYAENIYWVYGIVLKNKKNSKKIRQELQHMNIGTRPFFFPLNKQPVLKKYGIKIKNDCHVSNYLYQKGFYIPNSLNLNLREIEYIAKTINNLVN